MRNAFLNIVYKLKKETIEKHKQEAYEIYHQTLQKLEIESPVSQ